MPLSKSGIENSGINPNVAEEMMAKATPVMFTLCFIVMRA